MTKAQEIKFEDLGDGPGLLRFNLGDMRLTTQTHTFLQYIDLSKIENNVHNIQFQLTHIMTRLTNDTYSLY